MLDAVRWAMETDRNARYENDNPRPASPAILHTYLGSSGERDYASEALADALYLIFVASRDGKVTWANEGVRSLTRAMCGLQVAIAYDQCHDAWEGKKLPAAFTTRDGKTHKVPPEVVGQPVNAFLSAKLKENADSLVKSGGPGWPGDMKWGNNWNAVRFGGAAISYLACDEPRETWQPQFETAIRRLKQHKEANLSRSPDANGYNPEGIAYAQYPGWTTYPLLIALRRIDGRDLADEIPAMRRELWATYQGVLPIPRRSRLDNPVTKGPGLGLRPDFTDDHPIWEAEGTAALAFAVSPPEYLPGLKWIFRRLCGDLGDHTWDAASGNGLYSLIFYPDEIEEKNPADVWGLPWRDDAFGMFIFRDRYKDENDIVAQIVAKLRPTFGGHEGRDALGFRIIGLGVPWAVGSGRTTDKRGQTSLFAADPETAPDTPPGLVPSVVEVFQRRSGDGFVVLNIELSDTGVSAHTRRFVTDFSGRSGAPALFVVSDSSKDGRFWRLNTPNFNRIETSENAFTIVGPGGQSLAARILHPARVTPRTGEFKRGSPYAYREIGLSSDPTAMGTSAYSTNNRWVDFESPDGRFLVAMVLLPAGSEPPAFSSELSGHRQVVRVGNQTVAFAGNHVEVAGWTRPVLVIDSPSPEASFEGAPASVGFRGTVTDPDGLAGVTIKLGGREVPAGLEGGRWEAVLDGVSPGEHQATVIARDNVGDESSSAVSFRVHATAPPRVVIETPKSDIEAKAGSRLEIHGTAADPDGSPVLVEIFSGPRALGNATVEDGAFSWVWESLPVGEHRITAVATDCAGDRALAGPLRVRVPNRVGKGNVSDAACLWVGPYDPDPVPPVTAQQGKGFHPQEGGSQRWAIREGERVFRVRPTKKWDFSDRTMWILGSETARDWKLEWRMRMISPLDGKASALVHFGQGVSGPLAMDFRTTNSWHRQHRRGLKGGGTRLWYLAPNDNRNEIGWTHNPVRIQSEQPPDDLPSDFAGIPDDRWHTYRMEKLGNTLRVWRDGTEILAAESPWLATRGPVGFANERMEGSEFEITDISFDSLGQEP